MNYYTQFCFAELTKYGRPPKQEQVSYRNRTQDFLMRVIPATHQTEKIWDINNQFNWVSCISKPTLPYCLGNQVLSFLVPMLGSFYNSISTHLL